VKLALTISKSLFNSSDYAFAIDVFELLELKLLIGFDLSEVLFDSIDHGFSKWMLA